MENERQEREQDREKQAEAARAAGEHVAGRRGVLFAETLKTLSRLSSSYRRCHWKSASELIFPLLFQHMTFASHRTWKLYVKKAIFFAVEAWRQQYGESVLRPKENLDVASDPVVFRRDGLDPVTLVGWKKVARVDQETGESVYVYVGPHGQNCADLDEAFAVYDSSVDLDRGGPGKKAQQKLTFIEELLKIHQVTETVARDDTESGEATNLRALQATGEDVAVLEGSSLLKSSRPLAVTTSSLEDYLFRGSHPLLAGQMGLFLFFLWFFCTSSFWSLHRCFEVGRCYTVCFRHRRIELVNVRYVGLPHRVAAARRAVGSSSHTSLC